jgi:transposase
MSASLPSALRARFEECIKEGLRDRTAAARLKLSTATGVRWQRKLRKTGLIEPEHQRRSPGHGKLSHHQAFLEELVAQDGDITLPEFAGALEAATGVAAQAASIERFLRNLWYTYKKVAGCRQTAARPCEEAPPKLVQTPPSCHASAS